MSHCLQSRSLATAASAAQRVTVTEMPSQLTDMASYFELYTLGPGRISRFRLSEGYEAATLLSSASGRRRHCRAVPTDQTSSPIA
jgi:hypothetical protein